MIAPICGQVMQIPNVGSVVGTGTIKDVLDSRANGVDGERQLGAIRFTEYAQCSDVEPHAVTEEQEVYRHTISVRCT